MPPVGFDNKLQNGRHHDNGTEQLRPKVVYHPKIKDTQLVQFRKFVQKRFNVELKDYWELYEWSTQNYPEFWECMWKYFDIIHSQPYTEVFDRRRSFKDMEWFKGARLNYSENVFRYRDSGTALIVTDDNDNTERVTYKQMYDEVCCYAEALRESGVQRGDVVSCYMANRKEAIFAFLATASLGAVWSAALPLMGPKAVMTRFDQIHPKILFTGGSYTFDQKEISLDQNVRHIAECLPSLEKVVVVPSKTQGLINYFEGIPKSVSLEEFLAQGRARFGGQTPECTFEQMPFDAPQFVSFTSGTTGKPKALVHSVGSFLSTLRDFGLQQDCTRDDVMLAVSPSGWISWNLMTNCLHLGLTLVLYDGEPNYKSSTHYWDIVDKFGITSIAIWTTALEMMVHKWHVPTADHTLKSLRQIFLMGSPMKPETFEFIARNIKPGIFCGSMYGTTELFSCCNGYDHNLPIHKGEIQMFALGLDVRCLDENGDYVIGKRGNLVVVNPVPSLPICLYDDENKKKVSELYLNKFPGHWDQGDEGWINPVTKGFVVFGRSDETLLSKGARYCCSEIYFALTGFPGMVDSVCVAQFNKELDQRVVLFVKMEPGHEFTPDVAENIRRTIAEDLSTEHVPDVILECPDIPYNLSGKKLNLLVKKLVNKRPVLNLDVLSNPSSAEYFRHVPELDDF